jgi:hypothetical protein
MNKWDDIHRFYAEWDLEILNAGRSEWADDDAYLWDHVGGITLTPIERALWSDIRSLDLVLYPQYPVGRFFVDSGNPVAKVAIECDGKQWHDAARDALRDSRLREMGWTVYRFPGWECVTEQDAESGKSGSAYLRLKEIGELHRIRRGQ